MRRFMPLDIQDGCSSLRSLAAEVRRLGDAEPCVVPNSRTLQMALATRAGAYARRSEPSPGRPCREPARQSLLKPLSDGVGRASPMVALGDDLAGNRLAAPAGVRHAQAVAHLLEGLRPQCHALTDLAVGHGVADTHVHRCSAKWRVYATGSRLRAITKIEKAYPSAHSATTS